MSIATLLAHARDRYPERIALTFGDRRWSYRDLDETVERLALSLAAAGMVAGDRIAFLLTNCPELVYLYLACFKCGAIAVPLNVRLTGPELSYVLNHSGARLVVSHADLYPGLAAVRGELPGVGRCFIVGDPGPWPDTEPFEDLLGPHPGAGAWPKPAPDDPATILYTSGTTARPKGVTHTQGSLAATVRFYLEASGLGPSDALCGMLPMAHIFGFTLQMLAPLCAGATVVIVPRFDPGLVLGTLAANRVTHLYGLPVMFNALVNHPEAGRIDLGGLRYCLAGGDALPQAVNDRMRALFGAEIHEGCGMTEVIPYTLNRPGMENRVGSIGRPSVGMELRLLDPSGREVPPGEPGEIQIRSQALMAGYWQNPQATAETIRDGWLSTGDLAYVDADGWYWFVGRSKEIIVRGGSNISPLEVESALYSHPAVGEVAVVGVPDPVLGETVRAFVACKRDCTASVEALRQWAAERIAAYKVPESIVFLPELPKGLTGKVQRRALKSWAVPAA